MFPDFVSTCGAHLVYAQGRDHYTTHGKSIVYDGRDVSQDTTRSWVSPSCNGRTVVAAAGRNWSEPRIGRGELRAIWQLVPARAQLTHPPAGWTDENPRVLADGSVLFVRTKQTVAGPPGAATTTEHASLELLSTHNDAGLYSRRTIPGYGHIDCIFGKDAARDVYPLVLEHLDENQ